jgi:outer membrane protein OmpA-like peptidoglycan-associated protein/outer membrane protein W
MNMRNFLAAAAVMALPAAASAQPINGWYVGAGVGINQLLDSNFANVPGSNISHDVGIAGVGSVGYGFGGGLRAELEMNVRNQHGHSNPGNIGRNTTTYGPMVNLLYDFDTGAGINPYIGAGIGAQWMEMSGGGNSGEAQAAAQGILGLAVPMGAPGLALTAEARVLGFLGDIKAGGGTVRSPVNVSALLGLRYAFGETPAPPPPAPAPVPAPKAEEARTYLVFFDWDKADLTARARQIIAEAAGASQRLAVTRIEVSGHADTSGTPKYNMGLSMRRAQAVAAELVRLGVKKEAISIQAFGDTKPLVPTGPGVREPQNRRVEIVLK